MRWRKTLLIALASACIIGAIGASPAGAETSTDATTSPTTAAATTTTTAPGTPDITGKPNKNCPSSPDGADCNLNLNKRDARGWICGWAPSSNVRIGIWTGSKFWTLAEGKQSQLKVCSDGWSWWSAERGNNPWCQVYPPASGFVTAGADQRRSAFGKPTLNVTTWCDFDIKTPFGGYTVWRGSYFVRRFYGHQGPCGWNGCQPYWSNLLERGLCGVGRVACYTTRGY